MITDLVNYIHKQKAEITSYIYTFFFFFLNTYLGKCNLTFVYINKFRVFATPTFVSKSIYLQHQLYHIMDESQHTYGQYGGYVDTNGNDVVWNQQNDLYVSVIKPITKKIIHCTETKVNAYYKPVEMVEEVNTYVAKGDEHLVQLYKEIQEKKKKEAQLAEDKETKLKNNKSLLNKFYFRQGAHKKEMHNNKNSTAKQPILKLFKEDESTLPQIETVYVPKFEKNVEVVTEMKENVNVDYTYMIPKPVVIPVEVPVLKYKDNFKIVPIKKKIIPVIKYTDETIYVDCLIEKPYLVVENIVIPVPCDAPIEVKKYIDKAPPIAVETKQDTQEKAQAPTLKKN